VVIFETQCKYLFFPAPVLTLLNIDRRMFWWMWLQVIHETLPKLAASLQLFYIAPDQCYSKWAFCFLIPLALSMFILR